MELTNAFQQLGVALGLGLLVGLQRERTEPHVAGFRTFPLITVFGTLCGQMAESFGDWTVGVGLATLASVLLVGNMTNSKLALPGANGPGVTTEIAALIMFCVGVVLVSGPAGVAVTVAGGVLILLHLKPEMHALAAKIGNKDFKAMMQFALITLVVLPVLPNQSYGPFKVLNPFHIWLMVVLIVGVSLGGYLIHKLFGNKAGALISGVLGGLISSTATTVSYARRSRESPTAAKLAVVVILTASAMVYPRVIALIAVTGPALLAAGAWPLSIMFGLLLLLTVLAYWKNGMTREKPATEHSNPAELKWALLFAGLFSLVLLATAAAKTYLGMRGLYAVAALSGLTDMDAITLSVTQMVGSQQISENEGWRMVLLASMANLLFKAGIGMALGERRFFGKLGLYFAIAFAGGMLILVFWPA